MVLARPSDAGVRRETDRQGTHAHRRAAPADVPDDAALEAAGRSSAKSTSTSTISSTRATRAKGTGCSGLRTAFTCEPSVDHPGAAAVRPGRQVQRAQACGNREALRLLSYIYDARIVPVHYADGKVDVMVLTKDVWTLSPGISFARAGGSNDSRFNLQDTNFLAGARRCRCRTAAPSIEPATRGLDGSQRIRIALDLGARLLRLERRFAAVAAGHAAFYSLDAAWSAKITAVNFDRTVSRYNLARSSINSTTMRPRTN